MQIPWKGLFLSLITCMVVTGLFGYGLSIAVNQSLQESRSQFDGLFSGGSSR